MKPGFRLRFAIAPHLLRALALLVISAMTLTVQQIQAQDVKAKPQAAPTTAPTYEFEAASIKPTMSQGSSFVSGFTTDGYRASHETLQTMIVQAYGVRQYQISGGSSWLTGDFYDVEAKMEPSVADALKTLGPDQLKLAREHMLQALLADRFALKVRRETKDGPVYFLVVGKNGSKMQDAKPAAALQLTGPDGGGITGVIRKGLGSGGGTKAIATSVNIPYLTRYFSQLLRRPVLDKTGLTGVYDFTLDFVPDAGPTPAPHGPDGNTMPPDPGASIFTALQQQLGLKLEPGRGPVETLVITHVERPSGN
jgi:uncharacterized protein (TIGR03435 family)